MTRNNFQFFVVLIGLLTLSLRGFGMEICQVDLVQVRGFVSPGLLYVTCTDKQVDGQVIRPKDSTGATLGRYTEVLKTLLESGYQLKDQNMNTSTDEFHYNALLIK